jgi:hypothetical protein
MRSSTFFLILLIAAIPLGAQIELISDNYFPADLEFEELQNVTSENRFSNPEQLSNIDNGKLVTAVGFESYEQRIYAVKDSGSLSIEVITLSDYRASYSLLTLLRNSEIVDGPPGDAFASSPGNILFCHGKRWVRIRGQGVSNSLLHRVATSVSNRIGTPRQKFPSLVSYLPALGMDTTSLQYFPGSKSFESYTYPASDNVIQPMYDMEITRAFYSVENQSGFLYLLKFPTPQIAEQYYSELSLDPSSVDSVGMYLLRSGPLLCVLQGSFSSEHASDILGPIQYSYSVEWIYNKKPQSSTVWGIPVVILNSTVWSFFLVIVLCISSILAGAGLAGIRLLMRHFIPGNPLDDPKRTEITRLKLS